MIAVMRNSNDLMSGGMQKTTVGILGGYEKDRRREMQEEQTIELIYPLR